MKSNPRYRQSGVIGFVEHHVWIDTIEQTNHSSCTVFTGEHMRVQGKGKQGELLEIIHIFSEVHRRGGRNGAKGLPGV